MQSAEFASALTRSTGTRRARTWLLRRLGAVACCAALADWLFYGPPIGVSAAIFLVAMAVVTVIFNPVRASSRMRILAWGTLLAVAAALLENVNDLSIALGIAVLAGFSVVMVLASEAHWTRQMRQALPQLLRGPIQLVSDLRRFRAIAGRRSTKFRWLPMLSGWIVPLGMMGLFIVMFASANPLLESWLKAIDLNALPAIEPSPRLIFWLVVMCVVWSFVHVRARRKTFEQQSDAKPVLAVPEGESALFSGKAISRSLVLFNALFFVQIASDVAYLWGGMVLPHGMTYASYAHRGAYPLIGTALLAAAFVLIAMREGGPAERSRLIKPLVLTWVTQNIVLVASSIFRLQLYVASYSLTYQRIAAFIWFALVGLGLLLIVFMIIRRKSLIWLIDRNAMALAAMMLVCCFVNFADMIARYNVDHGPVVRIGGFRLDHSYLVSLGPGAIPAIDRLLRRDATIADHQSNYDGIKLKHHRDWLEAQHRQRTQNWQSWGMRQWRLTRYLDKAAARSREALRPETSVQ